jgi:hypothetical protein
MPRKKKPALYQPKYGWDDRWHALDYDGRVVIFFERKALAAALNRAMPTILTMEKKGVLCKPRLRLPRHPRPWLYTESQILDMITLAEEEGVIAPGYHHKFSARFINEAHGILSRMP